MKYLQKVTKNLKEGKVEKEDKGEIKAFVDSVGDNLVIDGEQLVKATKNGTITVWEETSKEAKIEQEVKAGKMEAPKKDEFDINKANVEQLKAFAAQKEIDLGEAKLKDEIKKVIEEALKQD